MKWPSVTIQIPVFREPFDAVIRPTLESARKAAERYRARTGERCNVLVCDDGLLCFADNDLESALANAHRTPPRDRSVAQYEVLARTAYYEKSGVAFKTGDGTHHNNYGSYELAKCIVSGIKSLKLGIAKYLLNDTPSFDPAHPDAVDAIKLPASPVSTNTKPLGN